MVQLKNHFLFKESEALESGLGYLDFWGTVVASHPSGGSLSSRLIPNDRPGDRLPVWSKIGGGAGVNGYGTEAVDE